MPSPPHTAKLLLFNEIINITTLIQFGDDIKAVGINEDFNPEIFSKLQQTWQEQLVGNIDGLAIGLQIIRTADNKIIFDEELIVKLVNGYIHVGTIVKHLYSNDDISMINIDSNWQLSFTKLHQPAVLRIIDQTQKLISRD